MNEPAYWIGGPVDRTILRLRAALEAAKLPITFAAIVTIRARKAVSAAMTMLTMSATAAPTRTTQK